MKKTPQDQTPSEAREASPLDENEAASLTELDSAVRRVKAETERYSTAATVDPSVAEALTAAIEDVHRIYNALRDSRSPGRPQAAQADRLVAEIAVTVSEALAVRERKRS